jgi:hypothetical protein
VTWERPWFPNQGNRVLEISARKGGSIMAAILLLLLVVAVLFGVGAAVHALWWVAIALLVIWLLGWVAHGSGRRWYYW